MKMQDADPDGCHPTRATGKLTGIPGSHIDCEIRSIDHNGAMVEIKLPRVIPSDVEFWEDATCSIHTCKVRWQRGRLLGLQFINPLQHDHARERSQEHLNHCMTYALVRTA